MSTHDPSRLGALAGEHLERAGFPVLCEYVTLACLSPAFDPDWQRSGAIAEAAELIASYLRSEVAEAAVEVVEIPGRTPVIFAELAARSARADGPTTLVYGHFDKQPPLGEWRAGLGPFIPVREGDRLYGRGTADDGYAAFAAASAIAALGELGVAHGRIVVLLEGSEESGSIDLEPYLDLLGGRIGELGLVVCLDSGGATYDRLWVTTSLRGNLTATLRVRVLDFGVHSGTAGGIVPSSFRIARALLSRIEDERTGEVTLTSTRVAVPPRRRAEMADAAALVGFGVAGEFPVVGDLVLFGDDPATRLERSTWQAALAVTGADGLPPLAEAGNVLRPETALRLSLRLPPTADADAVAAELGERLCKGPPDKASVELTIDPPASGWEAPETAPWLAEALTEASQAYFGASPRFAGTGGSIPFLASLARRYPRTQFVATGVLGPGSNAHGPNESLHVPTARAIASTLALLLARAP